MTEVKVSQSRLIQLQVWLALATLWYIKSDNLRPRKAADPPSLTDVQGTFSESFPPKFRFTFQVQVTFSEFASFNVNSRTSFQKVGQVLSEYVNLHVSLHRTRLLIV